MTLLFKLAILFVTYSDYISGAARPLPISLAASIFPRYSSVLALSTSIASTSQPVLGQAKAKVSIKGLETTSQPEQPGVNHQPADTAPCTTFTGNLGPNDEIGGTVDATKSTIASSQMNGAATLDAAIGAATMAQRTSSSFVIATTPTPSSPEGLWPISSEIATEPTSTVTIMTSTTRGGGAKETFSVSLLGDDSNSIRETTPSTPSSPMATTKTTTTTVTMTMTTTTMTMLTMTKTTTVTMTKKPAEMKCLYGRAATPGSIRYQDCGQKSDDILHGQDGPSPQTDPCSPGPGPTKEAAGKCGSWLNKIPSPHPLIQWFQFITVTLGAAYAFVKKMLGCRPQRRKTKCGETAKSGTSQDV